MVVAAVVRLAHNPDHNLIAAGRHNILLLGLGGIGEVLGMFVVGCLDNSLVGSLGGTWDVPRDCACQCRERENPPCSCSCSFFGLSGWGALNATEC